MTDGVRRMLLKLLPAALAATMAGRAQNPHQDQFPVPGVRPDTRPEETPLTLPKEKLQRDYQANLRDAHDLSVRAEAFEQDLAKSDPRTLSAALLKQLDEIERVTKRIRGRMRL